MKFRNIWWLVKGDEKLGVMITKVFKLYCPLTKVTEHCDATSLSTPAQQIMSKITAKKYLKIKGIYDPN